MAKNGPDCANAIIAACYESLIKCQPALVACIAPKDMAAYIGVMPVALSLIYGAKLVRV